MALEQHGLITTQQALAEGLSRSAIGRLVENGVWLPTHPHTFRLREVVPSWEQQVMAACLWGGPTAVASHRAAARLLGLGLDHSPIEIMATIRKEDPPT